MILEITGRLQLLEEPSGQKRTYLIASDADIKTIAELFEYIGDKPSNHHGKKVIITIEETDA